MGGGRHVEGQDWLGSGGGSAAAAPKPAESAGGKWRKSRFRAANRAVSTTFINADRFNFRRLVQKVTGGAAAVNLGCPTAVRPRPIRPNFGPLTPPPPPPFATLESGGAAVGSHNFDFSPAAAAPPAMETTPLLDQSLWVKFSEGGIATWR
ncbi:uncharacterized protein LOC144715815 [Wolffia australiana]